MLCNFFNDAPRFFKVLAMGAIIITVSKNSWHFGLQELIQFLHVIFVKIVNIAGTIAHSSSVPLFVLMFSLGLGSPFTLFIVMIQRCCHFQVHRIWYVYVVYNLI